MPWTAPANPTPSRASEPLCRVQSQQALSCLQRNFRNYTAPNTGAFRVLAGVAEKGRSHHRREAQTTPTSKPAEAPQHQTTSQTGPRGASSLYPAKSPPLGGIHHQMPPSAAGGLPGWGRGSPTANQAHLPEGSGSLPGTQGRIPDYREALATHRDRPTPHTHCQRAGCWRAGSCPPAWSLTQKPWAHSEPLLPASPPTLRT